MRIAYWGIVDSHGTSFHHTNVLLILMQPHSSILMCYWFSWYCIPAYLHVNNSRVALFHEVIWESTIPQYAGMRSPENQWHISILEWGHMRINNKSVWWTSILRYCWFSCDLIPTYCFIDSQMISSQHTNVLLILMVYHSSILICYWFPCDLIPAYWCVMLEWGNLRINNTSVC
jgi:hypothetical protein